VGGALCTDLYELRMAASHLRRGMTAPATFSLFARRLPPDRGFLVAARQGDLQTSSGEETFETGDSYYGPTTDVAETGADMTSFPTAGHLASWAGTCPGHNESAGE